MKGKRYRKKEKSKIKIFLSLLVLLILIGLMIFSGIKIIQWINENKENKKILDDIKNIVSIDNGQKGANKYNIDFKSLKQKNQDTVGWLKVNGTDIEYPVVQTSNNDYYMSHSFDKSDNSAGWVFVDYKNKLDGKDKNIVIYAHNRRDGSMFGSLKNILSENWQNNKENYIISFITEDEKAEYQVFSVYNIKKEDYYITTSFATNSEYEDFLKEIKARSEKDFNVEVNTQDNILTLSTCADNNQYRVVLHAKKIK